MLHELDDIRLTQAVTGLGEFDLADAPVTLPAGTEGTVMNVYHTGACGAEFFVGYSDHTPFGYIMFDLEPGQFEVVVKNAS